MRLNLGFSKFVLAGLLAMPMALAGQECDLPKTLAAMDVASAKFKSVKADFSWDQYVAAVADHEVESGVIYFVRDGSTTSMAAEIHPPSEKQLTFDGKELDLYTPGTNQLQIFSAGSNKAMAETFLTLGFGGSGRDLQKNWNVTCAGTEVIDGISTAKLKLTAKQASVSNTFSSVVIWVDPARAISLKQVFSAPSGDTKTDTFSNIEYNQPVSPSVFKIKTKPGVQTTRK